MNKSGDKGDWFLEDFADFDTVINADSFKMPTRVWAKAGYDREIVFVDDRGFSVWEHNLPTSGDSRHWITCIEPTGQLCPLCERGVKKYLQTFYTVIQTSGHWGYNDIWYQNKRRLFCAQPDVARVVKRTKGRMDETLKGRKFRLCRFDYSKEATDRCLEYLENVELEKLNNPSVFDYRTLLAPKSTEEIEKILKLNDVSPNKRKHFTSLSACFKKTETGF